MIKSVSVGLSFVQSMRRNLSKPLLPRGFLALSVAVMAILATHEHGGGLALAAQPPPGPPRSLAWICIDKSRGSLEQLRGRIVVVFFFKPGDPNSDKVLEAVRNHAASMEGQGVTAVGVALGDNPQQLATLLAEQRIQFPVHFDAKTGNAPVAKLWKVAPGTSRIFLLDPRLRVVSADVPPAKLGDALREQLELTPPEFVPAESLKLAAEKLTIAETMLAAGRTRSAARYLAELPDESRTDPATASRVSAATLSLDEKLKSLIDESEALFNQDKIAAAALILEHAVTALKDSPARARVEEQLFSFTDDPDLRARIEQDRPAALADDLLTAAAEHEELLDTLGAYKLCRRILAEFPTTPAAVTARERVANWEKTPAETRRFRDATSGPAPNQLLSTARSYRKSNLIPKAKQFYQQLLSEYPGTTAAAAAEKDLAELK